MTILATGVAAASLTLGLIHAGIWLRDRTARGNLGVAILAVGVSALAWTCLALAHAATPQAFLEHLRWLHVSGVLIVGGTVYYIRADFRTSTSWLGHLAFGIRLLMALVAFARTGGVNYVAVSSMHAVRFAGEPVFVADGIPSVWTALGQLGMVLLLAFIADATWKLWVSGNDVERRRALVVGISTFVFILLATAQAALIFGGVLRWPHTEFVAFLGLLCAFSYELGADALRAVRLARALQTSEAALRESDLRMSMAADAAGLGMWIWDLETGELWLTDKCRQLFGFEPGTAVSYGAFLGRLHPEDRSAPEAAIQDAAESGAPCRTEFRIVPREDQVHWIATDGRVDTGEDGTKRRMLGVCIDITDRRIAELAAQELSGRLITAQEEERSRIARELHDDLSQRVALLSVELELLSRGEHADAAAHIEAMASSVRELGSEVHRMSYQLHPAKLDQLGLVSAARSWCRDVARQSGVRVEFMADGVADGAPDALPADVALCLFRIVQEALRNVVRHSRAANARVDLARSDGRVRLTVADDGCGFELRAPRREGLGLLSMRERVRLLHGRMAIESRPGAGTTVAVNVPVGPPPPET